MIINNPRETPCEEGPIFEEVGSIKKWCCIAHAFQYCNDNYNKKHRKMSKSDSGDVNNE